MPRFRKFIAVAGLFVAIAIGPTHVNQMTPLAAAALSITAPIPVAEAMPCELICFDDAHYCEEGSHDAFFWPGLEEYYDSLIQGGSHNGQTCWSGDCVTMHSKGMCDPPEGDGAPLSVADLESLRLAMANGDGLALRVLLTSFPSQIRPNVGRDAVQVVTCATVVAHLPAPAALVAELAALVEPL